MKNINLLINKTFYKKIDDETQFQEDVKAFISEILETTFLKEDFRKTDIEKQSFCLKTTYPGMLAGLGYWHDGLCDEDINGGFSIDYVSGQPYIPGSSVKGIIRSAFLKEGFVETLLESIGKPIQKESKKALENNIFEGNDIFFDAVIKHGDRKGLIFAKENITPHKSPIKNPIPLSFLKVRPEVVWEFRFQLKDYIEGNIEVTKKDKEKLFKAILLVLGVGAKTNVGFGALEEVDEAEEAKYQYPPKREVSNNQNSGQQTGQSNNQNTRQQQAIVAGYTCEGKVTGYNDKKTVAFIELSGIKKRAQIYFSKVNGAKFGKIDEKLKKDTTVTVKYEGKDDKGYDQWSLVKK